MDLIYKEEVFAIVGAAMKVHKVGVLINFGSHTKLEWKRFVL